MGCDAKTITPWAKTYDPKCYELAELFLRDHDSAVVDTTDEQNTELNRADLASRIQDAIEDWFAGTR